MSPADRASLALLVLLLALPGPAAAKTVAAPTSGGGAPPTAEVRLHRPLALATVADYLREWQITSLEPREDAMVARIRYKENTYLFRFRVLAGDVLLIRVEDFIRLTRSNLHFERFAGRLLEENERLVVGKFTWDSGLGVVALEHAIVARGGLSFDDFTDVMVRLLVTADQKYPDLMKALWQ